MTAEKNMTLEQSINHRLYLHRTYPGDPNQRTDKVCKEIMELLQPQWISIEEHGLPPEGMWYDAYTWTREGHRTVRELFFDGENDYGIHWLGDGDWLYPVTHYCDRTDPPREEHE